MSGPGRIALAGAFWTSVALVFTLPELRRSHDWLITGLSALAQWWSWGLLAPVIVAIDQRLPFSTRHPVRRIVVHCILGPAFALIYAYLSTCVAAVLRAATWSQLLDSGLLAHAWAEMFWSLLVYGLIVGVSQAYHYQQRYASAELDVERLERSFSEARLNSLRMQLDPHFLFNALNTISSQVERDPRLARTMIEHLGDLLRLSLSSQRRPAIPLTEELSFLDHYLAIQKIRFGDSLRIEMSVSAEARQVLVPSMLLQPLVENAIRHGLSPRAGGGVISLSAACVNDELHIRVLDDGVGLPTEWPSKSQGGLGLSITRERIAGLHPHGAGRFSIQSRAGGGTAVDIFLPLETTAEIDERHVA